MTRHLFETTSHSLHPDPAPGAPHSRDVSLAVHRMPRSSVGARDPSKSNGAPSVDALPAVVLHGFSGTGLTMASLGSALSAARTILLPDLPHHGRTRIGPVPTAPMSMAETVDLLTAWLDDRDIAPCHLLGYSMGARTALSLATAKPSRVRSLVLISGTPGLGEESERAARRAADDDLADRIVANGIEWFLEFWNALPLFGNMALGIDTETAELLRRELRSADPAELAKSLRGMGTGQMPPLHRSLSVLTEHPVPLLLIVGDHDHKYRRLAAAINEMVPDATTVVIKDAAHRPHLDNPVAVSEAILSFWSGVGEPR